jgi:hypothetical protein
MNPAAIRATAGSAVATAAIVTWVSLSKLELAPCTELTISRLGTGATTQTNGTPATTIHPDCYKEKYTPAHRAEFHVSSTSPVAIFVLATGVQVRTSAGWLPSAKESPLDDWTLKTNSGW